MQTGSCRKTWSGPPYCMSMSLETQVERELRRNWVRLQQHGPGKKGLGMVWSSRYLLSIPVQDVDWM
jgi:hypothetical protein